MMRVMAGLQRKMLYRRRETGRYRLYETDSTISILWALRCKVRKDFRTFDFFDGIPDQHAHLLLGNFAHFR